VKFLAQGFVGYVVGIQKVEVSTVTTLETLQKLQTDAASGALARASSAELERYSAALCDAQAPAIFASGQFAHICETVHLHLLHAHIKELSAKNSWALRAVIALAVASLLGSAGQVWHEYRAEKKAEAPRLTSPHGKQAPALIPSPHRFAPEEAPKKKS
jgi:hypothetical protein